MRVTDLSKLGHLTSEVLVLLLGAPCSWHPSKRIAGMEGAAAGDGGGATGGSSLLSQLESLRAQLASKDAQMSTLQNKLAATAPVPFRAPAQARSAAGASNSRTPRRRSASPAAGGGRRRRSGSPATHSSATNVSSAARISELAQPRPRSARRRASVGTPRHAFGSSGKPRNEARVPQQAVPLKRPASSRRGGGGGAGASGERRRSLVPRCATPEARRPRTARGRSDEQEQELLIRARWNAELERVSIWLFCDGAICMRCVCHVLCCRVVSVAQRNRGGGALRKAVAAPCLADMQ